MATFRIVSLNKTSGEAVISDGLNWLFASSEGGWCPEPIAFVDAAKWSWSTPSESVDGEFSTLADATAAAFEIVKSARTLPKATFDEVESVVGILNAQRMRAPMLSQSYVPRRSLRGTSSTLVLGGGPGGLCAAFVLSKAGAPTIVLEGNREVGGLARTIRRKTEHGEFRFDIGGHRWFTKNDRLNDLFKEVVDDEIVWVNRISRIYFDGKYVDYPLKISNALKAIGPVTSAKAMADYGRTRAQKKVHSAPVESMEDAYIDQFGPTLYKLFFKNYSEKVWGLPCNQMSGDWVTQRSKGMSIVTAVKDGVTPSKAAVISLIDEFMYPKYGFGRLSERMADKITAMGNEVKLGAAVTKVFRSGNRVTGVMVETEGGFERLDADNYISSIPLPNLVKIMEPSAPSEVLVAAESLVFRNIITVNLMLKRTQVTSDTWLYVHDKRILFGRFHEPKNWSPFMVPGDEFTSLVIEYFCSFGDHIWEMTEEELVENAVGHLVNDLKFIDRSEVIGGFTIRAPRAYPTYVMGYEKPLNAIRTFIDQFENLQIIGRYGTFRYNNTDHSVETGLLAAENILGEWHAGEQVDYEVDTEGFAAELVHYAEAAISIP